MASSSQTTPASPLSSSAPLSCWKYDVFLSFRGPDTRRSITSQLYERLQSKGIKTFMDRQDLLVGDEISSTLLTAIGESRFAIVVLSTNYASSTWCLEEITKICQCMEDNNRILPLFYQVTPADVRHQKRSFEKAFTDHENSGRHRSEKLQNWRDALKKVASFSGWNTESYETDEQLLQDIVKFVYSKVQPMEIKTGDFEATRQALKLKLLSANLLVDDAEEKQISLPEVRKWLFELKDTLYHASDLLCEIDTEDQRRKLEGDEDGSSSISSQNLNSTSFYEFKKALKLKMVHILERLEVILNEAVALGLKVATDKNRPESRTLETTSLVDGSDVYGRNEDKEMIKKLLLSGDATGERIGVIAIVGMGGLGKTTLAQLVYNDVDVEEEFDLQAWVCVSEEFDILIVTRAIYVSITSEPCAITQLDPLQRQLKKSLRNKKFLLVLDDVWNENYSAWEALKRPFNYGAFGSKIIVTTRSEGVANVMRTLPSHKLKQISEEDSWLLFAKHALGSNGDALSSQHPDLAEIGKQIAKKCKGLPLSAKSIGGLLRCERTKDKWEKILESDVWELSSKETDILPALWISYRYLPSHLKRCFAYCSIFPKDYVFAKVDLVRMWMAEDLLQPDNKKMMDELGEDYFNTLLSRSFFQNYGTDRRTIYDERESYFIMHDLMSDLAKYVSGDFCLRSEDKDSPNDVSKSCKTRHFSFTWKCNDGKCDDGKFEAFYKAESLHTFTGFHGGFAYRMEMAKVLPGLLPTFQYLRLLNLSLYGITELPSSIGNLKHLRHLDLSYNPIVVLPDTLCTLYNLQTLLLRNCDQLVELPTKLGRLVNLRHLYITESKIQKMPPHMGGLKHLQLLSFYAVCKDAGHSIAELKELQHLRGVLTISRLENVVCGKDALEANMKGKKHLSKLLLKWSEGFTESSENDTQVLEQLQPHTNLKSLVIGGYRGTLFPNWLGQLPSLEILRIYDCNGVVSTGSTPKFLSLTDLSISNCPKFVRFPDAPKLKTLSLHNCPELESFPEGGLPPALENLELWGNKKLFNRNRWGLQGLKSLKKFTIRNEEEMVLFPEEGLLPSTLTFLELLFLPNLTSIDGKQLRHLNSLQKLSIWFCPKLECFPEEGLPTSLKELDIWDCPLLEERCERGNGQDWPKIAHISTITLG